ncbi:hypothetical protein Tco_0044165, partial [Tanacetum coccineum]
IQEEEDTTPSEITRNIPQDVEGFEPPQEEVILIHRSERTRRATNRVCLNVEVEEHSLRDLGEPANYKAAMLDPESKKWVDAMNAEMQSMIDNMVWVLVDLPPNCKTVGSIYMVQPEGFCDPKHPEKNATQRSIYGTKQASRTGIKRIDEESKREAAFILRIKIYRDRSKRLIGLSQNAYMDKILKRYKMDNSKRGTIPMQERLDLNKSQGAQTPKEVNHMKNVVSRDI